MAKKTNEIQISKPASQNLVKDLVASDLSKQPYPPDEDILKTIPKLRRHHNWYQQHALDAPVYADKENLQSDPLAQKKLKPLVPYTNESNWAQQPENFY